MLQKGKPAHRLLIGLWQTTQLGWVDAATQMAEDERLLYTASNPNPFPNQLLLYRFNTPTITAGRHTRLATLWSTQRNKSAKRWLVRRPTAGGAVLHAGGICFSFLFENPNGKEKRQAAISEQMERLHLALKTLGIPVQSAKENSMHSLTRPILGRWCTHEHAHTDIVVNGKKLGGVGQRILRERMLLQGYLTTRKRECRWMKRLIQKEHSSPNAIQPTSIEDILGRPIPTNLLFHTIERAFDARLESLTA